MEERDEEKLARAEKVRQLLIRLHSRFKQVLESEGPARGLYRVLEEEGIRAAVQEKLDALVESGDEAEAEDLRLGWESLMGFLDAAETVRQLRAESGEEMAVSDCIELLRTVAADTPLTPRPQTLDSVLAGDLSRCGWGRSGRLSSSAATKGSSPGPLPLTGCSPAANGGADRPRPAGAGGARRKTSSTSGFPPTRRSRPRRNSWCWPMPPGTRRGRS